MKPATFNLALTAGQVLETFAAVEGELREARAYQSRLKKAFAEAMAADDIKEALRIDHELRRSRGCGRDLLLVQRKLELLACQALPRYAAETAPEAAR